MERCSVSVEAALRAWGRAAPATSAETARPTWMGEVRSVSAAPSRWAAVPSPSAEAPLASVQTARQEGEQWELVVHHERPAFQREVVLISPERTRSTEQGRVEGLRPAPQIGGYPFDSSQPRHDLLRGRLPPAVATGVQSQTATGRNYFMRGPGARRTPRRISRRLRSALAPGTLHLALTSQVGDGWDSALKLAPWY